MPADGDRILANLPPTFRALPRPSALAAVADAFGGELRDAENSLAAMMLSHWVDFADLNTDQLEDLASIAALYGLAPRDDETVEGFRGHLKRYVRTFIEGTTTVRGIFRITAEALGLLIADDQLDTWWDRPGGSLLGTTETAPDDAATLLFGTAAALVRGAAAAPAAFVGSVEIPAVLDLRGQSMLSVAVNGTEVSPIDLGTLVDAANATLPALVTAIGSIAGLAAEARGNRLVLRTRATGSAAALVLNDAVGDVVPALLGIAPLIYAGRDASPARIVGTRDLPATLDLSSRGFLRLSVDGMASEIDCSAATTLAGLVSTINAAVGASVASAQGMRLAIMSAAQGLSGSIAVLGATAQDAAPLLFGDAARFARGANAAPARVVSQVDLSRGIDLSQRSRIGVAIDRLALQVIDCAGPTPAKTLAGDIATAINAAIGQPVATQNGAAVTITSLQVGAAGRVRFAPVPTGDALQAIFGLLPRAATGADATAARLTGSVDLAGGVDVSALQRIQVAVDDDTPVIVDLAAAGLVTAGLGTAGARADDIATAINDAVGVPVASVAAGRLSLGSPTLGAAGSVAILPIERTLSRRFVSRAFPSQEASATVFGSFAADANGGDGSAARLLGVMELHDGLDLSKARYLRLLDGGVVRDIDCAAMSLRPRAVRFGELVNALDAALGAGAASVSSGRLVLTAPTLGPAGALSLGAGAGDATGILFGAGVRAATGLAPTRVTFIGLKDLSQRIDLSVANRVRLAIDGAAQVEIVCAGDNPAATSVAEIAGRINAGLRGGYASTDGTVLRLASSIAGSGGGIGFLAPTQDDATQAIFGIAPGRTYHGEDAAPAVLSGVAALPGALDLRAAPFIRVQVDGGTPVLVDCRGTDPTNTTTTPAEVVQRIAAAVPGLTAAMDGDRVVLTAGSAGSESRIALLPVSEFDATSILLGAATAQPGTAATPATLTGNVDLRQPVDLSVRSMLRLSIDGGRPLDVDISGAAPDATFGDEVVAMLSAAQPNLARIDGDGHLVLTSPTVGPDSRLSLLPLRPLELIDYPAAPVSTPPQTVGVGGVFTLHNDGAADSQVTLTLTGQGGLCGIDLINLTSGMRIRIDGVSGPGDSIVVAPSEDGGIDAALLRADGSRRALPAGSVRGTPAVLTVEVPLAGELALAANEPGTRPAIALFDPLAINAVLFEAVAVPLPELRVVAADRSACSAPPLADAGRLRLIGLVRGAGGRFADLVDGAGATIARLRAGAGVVLAPFDGMMVVAEGTFYPDSTGSLLVVDLLARVFDVTVGGTVIAAVAIDARAGAGSLAGRLAATAGAPVIARDIRPADALLLPRGRSDWLVMTCDGARFDSARFNLDRFAGGVCDMVGVFDASRFEDASERAHFAPFGSPVPITVTATWDSHQPGSFAVNLPADLPATFGARFNAARFTSPADSDEIHRGVVFDPPNDPDCLTTLLAEAGTASPLVFAAPATSVPLGWEPQVVPFAQPRERFLTGGRADRPAAIYLQEPGVAGFIVIMARENGAWGDEIGISLRFAGPALFDLTVSYAGARFECGREIVFAGRILRADEPALPPLIADLIKPAPVGVARAKAAGVAARVTRDRT